MPADKKDVRKTSVKKRSSWENIKVIFHSETLLAVRINRLNVRPHPEYTFEIGYVEKNDTDRFHRYLKPRIEIKDGVVELWELDAEGMPGLIWIVTQAYAFILGETQKREHELQLQRKANAPRKKAEGKRPNT